MSLGRAPRVDQAPGYVEFVREHGPALQRLARGLVRDDHDAADLTQEVLASALVNWRRVVAADEPLAYARRMTVNAATSWWRRPARRERPTATGELPGPRSGPPPLPGSAASRHHAPDHAEAHAQRDELMTALRALPRRQRAVLVLRHHEGLDDAEIADLLGVGASTVRSNAARGIAALRAAGLRDETGGLTSDSRRHIVNTSPGDRPRA